MVREGREGSNLCSNGKLNVFITHTHVLANDNYGISNVYSGQARGETTLKDKFEVSNQLFSDSRIYLEELKCFYQKCPVAMTQWPDNLTWLTESLHKQCTEIYLGWKNTKFQPTASFAG